MKKKSSATNRTRVQLCSTTENALHCGGHEFVPDAATAYVEFFMAHSFPVYLDQNNPGERADHTTLHPRVVANSYRSLVGKVMNLAHIMKKYDAKKNQRDRILGTVMAVEFGALIGGEWTVVSEAGVLGLPSTAAGAYGIRAVAALHKNAEGVSGVLTTWAEGRTMFTKDTEWTVSMENESDMSVGGFLIQAEAERLNGLQSFCDSTPEEFKALGWIYVPYADAPQDLLDCLKEGEYIGMQSDYKDCATLFLNGGLDGSIFFYGVALTPGGKESHARVGRMVASSELEPALVELGSALDAITEFARKVGSQAEPGPN